MTHLEHRIEWLRNGAIPPGPVVFWMSRDQRVADNWALLFAQEQALRLGVPLVVLFCFVPGYLGTLARQERFMRQGLVQVAHALDGLRIPFLFLEQNPVSAIPPLLDRLRARCLVADFTPLRLSRDWKRRVADAIRIPFAVVDAHNIVPCRAASPRAEFAARTFRPKLLRLLPDFLVEPAPMVSHPFRLPTPASQESVPFADIADPRAIPDRYLPPSGEAAARRCLDRFLQEGLDRYDRRNDPNAGATSGLSPYLHFGQLSAQRVALAVTRSGHPNAPAFLEELVVRRELSDNFCFRNPDYDRFEGFPAWARRTLDAHRGDPRSPCYGLDAFEASETHDPLWNAAQTELRVAGRMHGYLRMYWAKKILEWSASPEEALAIAITLNDRYQLDGRDPNGYAGIAWSLGGVHDRPWGERPVFGQVRYMSRGGCERKFDVDRVVRRADALVRGGDQDEAQGGDQGV